MPEEITSNTVIPSGLSTAEGAAREGQLAMENNFSSVTGPSIPVITQYSPNVSTDWMYEEIPMPSYASLKMGAGSGIKQMEEGITAKGNDSPDFFYGRAGRYETASNPYDPYNYKVPVSETHTMLHSGKWISRYPNYFRGVNNEDLYARQQTTSQKFWNGIYKFGAKVGINVLGNLSMLPNKIYTAARECSIMSALNTPWEKTLDDWTKMTDYALPHYYRQETNDYNLWQKMWKDSGNFIMNDVIGNGMAFTVGAMITGLATAPLGIGASSLGRIGARLGMRAASRSSMRAAGKAASTAARDAARRSTGKVKSLLNEQVRAGASMGRTAGEAVGTLNTLAMTSAYEASVEANDFMNTSKEDFIDYYNQVYGRNPSQEEMADFMESTRDVASWVFGANMAIVGLSNWLLFGKYIGMGGQFIPGVNKRLGKVFQDIGKTAEGANRGIKKTLFGIGTEVKAPGQYAIKVVDQNLAQKIAATTWNVSKRPISEGLFEEGLQGVAQNAAKEYVDSRYNSIKFENAVSGLDAIREGFEEQYTSKEGWTEIGIGAIIGGFFGFKEGFGFTENSRTRKRLAKSVEEYNKKADNLNKAVLNTIKQAVNLSPQMSIDAENMTSREFEDAAFAKMAVEDQLGILGDSRENFKTMLDGISNKDLAAEMHITEEEAKRYKEQLLDSYDLRVDIYNDAAEFASSIVGDDSKTEFKEYIARNAYLGMMAYEKLDDIAGEIERLSGKPDIREALKTYSTLSTKAMQAARDMMSIQDRIDEIEKQLQKYASQPRATGEKDPLADEIRRKTGELEDERTSLISQMDQLSKMVGQEFSINNFRATRERALDTSATGTGYVTAQEIMDAYNALSAFDDYFVSMNADQRESTQNQAIRSLIREYRENLLNFRNMNNFMTKMMDKRFMANEYKGFTALLKDIWSTPYDDTLERDQPWFIESGKSKKYNSDAEVDKAMQDGKITEDEAFTIKAFMHAADKIRSNNELLNRPDVERVSDYELIRWRNFDPNDRHRNIRYETDENGNPVVITEWDHAPNKNTRDRIVNSLWMGKEDLLSPREREVYEMHKAYFDEFVGRMPASPKAELEKLRKQVEDITSTGALIKQNNGVIDFVRSKLTDESRDRLDKAMARYEQLSTDTKDVEGGLSEEEIAERDTLRDEINQIGAEVLNAQNVLTDFIDQNRLLQANARKQGELVTDYGSNTDQLTDLTSLETNDQEKIETERMQNPSTMMARLTEVDGMQVIEVSGLQAPVLLGVTNKPGKTCRIRLWNVEGNPEVEATSETTNGITTWTIQLPGGNTVTLRETNNHARFILTPEDAATLARETNFVITNIGSAYQVIYEKVPGGKLIPFETRVGYGENESERINEGALAKVTEGTEVEFEVDTNDTFNQELYRRYLNEYQSAESEEARNDAFNKLKNNLVIKIYAFVDGNWELVSVAKANFGDVKGNIEDVRQSATDTFIRSMNGGGKPGGSLRVMIKKRYSAAPPIPGHPNFELEDNGDGTYRVVNRAISEKGSEKIYGVGYIMNGQIYMRTEDKKNNFMRYPYVTRILRQSKEMGDGRKYPVVALRLPNGKNVLYPVQLSNVTNETAERIASYFEGQIQGLESADYVLLDSERVREANDFMLRSGLEPKTYQLGFTANPVSDIQRCIDEIRRVGSLPDVEAWLSDESRSVREVAQSDVLINLNLEGQLFVAPMMRVRFGKAAKEAPVEGEPTGGTAPVRGPGPMAPINNPGDLPFGPDGGANPTAGTETNQVSSVSDLPIEEKKAILDSILSELKEKSELLKGIAVFKWSSKEGVTGDVNDFMLQQHRLHNVAVPMRTEEGRTGEVNYELMMSQLVSGLAGTPGYSVSISKEAEGAYIVTVTDLSTSDPATQSASNLSGVADNSEARREQNKPC